SDLAFYRQTSGTSSAVCGLMMGMARADNGIIMTPRVESVLHHELQADTVFHACPEQAGLALAAVRRGFHAIVHAARADQLAEQTSNSALRREIDRGSIAVSDALPTPEQLVGYLSRGYVPMLRSSFRRLHHDAGRDWRLVTDFDGFLFCIVDPEMPPESEATATAVTTSEMRASLRDERAVAVILLKPGSASPTRI
ncbi:MAG: hypothetical protein JWL97_3551, partial [Gemmatimonadales bacterium]|nr:hypothetical protein [Gemmatimonadales bacterium]